MEYVLIYAYTFIIVLCSFELFTVVLYTTEYLFSSHVFSFVRVVAAGPTGFVFWLSANSGAYGHI